MPQTLAEPLEVVGMDEEIRRRIADLVTVTDDPVDNPFSEKQQRLSMSSVHHSWTPLPLPGEEGKKRTFWAASNVGIFESVEEPPLAPDGFISEDVVAPLGDDNRAYFFWDHGKMPEVVLEIVSNKHGGELTVKKSRYQKWKIRYYIVHDPFGKLTKEPLQVFELVNGRYRKRKSHFFEDLNIGVTLWTGEFEGVWGTFMRWCDRDGRVLPTPYEAAAMAKQEAERAQAQSEQAQAQVEQAQAQAEQAHAQVEQAQAQVEQAHAQVEQAQAQVEQAQTRAEEAEALAEQETARRKELERLVQELMSKLDGR